MEEGKNNVMIPDEVLINTIIPHLRGETGGLK